MKAPRLGTTLVFARDVARGVVGVKQSFVIRAGTYREAVREVRKIADQEAQWTFVAIDDFFRVSGDPSRDGSLLGRTTIWGCKTAERARALVEGSTRTRSRTADRFLAEVVFFVGPPHAKGNRHAIEAEIVVHAKKGAGALRRATLLARSLAFRAKLVLGNAVGETVESLQFVGIKRLDPIWSTSPDGPYSRFEKPFRSLAALRKAFRREDPKLKGFFRHRLPES